MAYTRTVSRDAHIWVPGFIFFIMLISYCDVYCLLLDSSPESERETPSPVDPECIEIDVNFNPDPADLVLSSVPGGELFNPRKHKFAEEDLKPQPMIKKAKKVFVPDEQKVTDFLYQTDKALLGVWGGLFLYVEIHLGQGQWAIPTGLSGERCSEEGWNTDSYSAVRPLLL